MKRYLFISILFLAFSSCDKNSDKNLGEVEEENTQSEITYADSIKALRELDENFYSDTVRNEKSLKIALQSVRDNYDNIEYYKSDTTNLKLSPFNDIVTVEFGYLFNPKERHVIIRRLNPIDYYIDIYWCNDEVSDFESVLSYTGGRINYVNDTIQDVNGDNKNDFVLSWFPSSGCCLRDVKNVYLQEQNNINFTSFYEFINPDFIPKEKAIRGVLYGHPGEVGMYDYKWNSFEVDTIDYLYPNLKDTIERTYWLSTKNDRILLDEIPEKYQRVSNIDWFNMY